jgi:DNA-binding CsgD family transcriptional regulator
VQNMTTIDKQLDTAYTILSESPDVQTALERIKELYGLHHIVFHLGQTSVASMDSPFVRTTYPDAWVSRYLLKGYVNIDPVVREGFTRQLPFDWRELTPTAEAMDMMIDAAQHNVGTCGYSVPIVDRTARRSLFSITSILEEDAWDEFVKTHNEKIQEIAYLVHRKALEELFGELDPMPQLGPREIECLTWTARGKDYLAIAQILSISGHTARGYLKSARFKLECATLPQAVAKAITLKLIEE